MEADARAALELCRRDFSDMKALIAALNTYWHGEKIPKAWEEYSSTIRKTASVMFAGVCFRYGEKPEPGDFPRRCAEKSVQTVRRKMLAKIIRGIGQQHRRSEEDDSIGEKAKAAIERSLAGAEKAAQTEGVRLECSAAVEVAQQYGYEAHWKTGTGECELCRHMNGALLDTGSGKGVKMLPPAHEGCTCSIELKKVPLKIKIDEHFSLWYNENVEGNPDQEKKYELALQKAKTESKIKGTLTKPKVPQELETFKFDADHVHRERHRDIDREEAISFIENAIVSIERDGYLNFYSADGGTYIIQKQKKIRTTFRTCNYKSDVLKMLEVIKREL